MHTQTSVNPSVILANLSTQEKKKLMSHCVLVISLYMYMTYMHVLFFLVHIVLADIYSFKIKKVEGHSQPILPPLPSRA